MENAQDLKCLHCDSERVVVGHMHTKGKDITGIGLSMFKANELKKMWITKEDPALPIYDENGAVLCLDCGLVWTSVNVEDATRKLSKYGTDELKSRVGLD